MKKGKTYIARPKKSGTGKGKTYIATPKKLKKGKKYKIKEGQTLT